MWRALKRSKMRLKNTPCKNAFKKHPLQNRTNVQIKGGGGQRPFDQCSKKLHFFEMSASLSLGLLELTQKATAPFSSSLWCKICFRLVFALHKILGFITQLILIKHGFRNRSQQASAPSSSPLSTTPLAPPRSHSWLRLRLRVSNIWHYDGSF